MKVFISSDMEGTAGVVDWAQCLAPAAREYQYYRGLLQDEVNAAIEGAHRGRRRRVPGQRLALEDGQPAP